jgi:hypothetical protein
MYIQCLCYMFELHRCLLDCALDEIELLRHVVIINFDDAGCLFLSFVLRPFVSQWVHRSPGCVHLVLLCVPCTLDAEI